MIIIPIGVDCGCADFLKEQKLRRFSLPFDWIVTYDGISDILKNNFKDFVPNDDNNMYNKEYKLRFIHNHFPSDTEKMNRRVNRFKEILETSNEKIIFFRKGHAHHHHSEQLETTDSIIKSDIKDAEDLDTLLKDKYPNLSYEIIVILICGTCFDSSKTYESYSKNIRIFNITVPDIINNMSFINEYNNLCKKILLIEN